MDESVHLLQMQSFNRGGKERITYFLESYVFLALVKSLHTHFTPVN